MLHVTHLGEQLSYSLVYLLSWYVAPVQSATWQKEHTTWGKHCVKKLQTIRFFWFKHVSCGNVRNTNLSQAVSFAERLVGHVFKLLWDRTRAPSGWVVLDHRGVELGHGLKSEWRRLLSPHSYTKTRPVDQITHDLHLFVLTSTGSQPKEQHWFLQQCTKTDRHWSACAVG